VKKLHIRKLEKKDAIRMLEWMHDETVTCYLAQNFAEKTLEDCENFIDSSNKDESLNVHRAICDDKDMYLGTVSLKHINITDKNAEYAISMHGDSIGTGASAFGTKQILTYAFEELKLEKVYLNVIPSNVRAKKFYNKMGFELEGIAKKHICIKGKLEDLEWYGYLKEK
jgi:diamine N-acetyltransferase